MSLQEILTLFGKKYPESEDGWSFPALLIYDDGTGRIIKNPDRPYGNSEDLLFSFGSVEELIGHLIQ